MGKSENKSNDNIVVSFFISSDMSKEIENLHDNTKILLRKHDIKFKKWQLLDFLFKQGIKKFNVEQFKKELENATNIK